MTNEPSLFCQLQMTSDIRKAWNNARRCSG